MTDFEQIQKAKKKFISKYAEIFKHAKYDFKAFITKRNEQFALYALIKETDNRAKEFTENVFSKTFEYDEKIYRVIIGYGTYTKLQDK